MTGLVAAVKVILVPLHTVVLGLALIVNTGETVETSVSVLLSVALPHGALPTAVSVSVTVPLILSVGPGK